MFPQAEDLARYWNNILNRVDAITEVPESHWRADDYHDQDPKARDRTYCRRGGFLSAVDFPPLDFGIAPHSIEATDTTIVRVTRSGRITGTALLGLAGR